MQQLFAYGTLRYPKYQKQAFGRAVNGKPVVLHGYRKKLKMMPDGRYFVIVPEKNRSVRGIAFLVSSKELSRIDAWELGYHRIKVRAGGVQEWAYAPKHERHSGRR